MLPGPDPPINAIPRHSIGPAPRNVLMDLLDRHAPRAYDAIRAGQRAVRPRPGPNPFNALAKLAGLDDPLSMVEGPAAAVAPVARAGRQVVTRLPGVVDEAADWIQSTRALADEAIRKAPPRLKDVRRMELGYDNFKFDTTDGPISVVVRPKGDQLTVEWVGKPMGSVQDAASPGFRSVRNLLSEVAERYPDAKRIRFERVSGSRMGPAADKSKDLWVDIPIPGRRQR